MGKNKFIAEVTQVTAHPIVEVSEGVEAGGFTVHAKMITPTEDFSMGLFYVRILEPVELRYHQPEQGLLMEDGKFSFDTADEVGVKDKLEISVSPAE
jgi:hypothetical protein